MTEKKTNKITIAISSRTLFDLRKEHEIFENEGLKKFVEHQIKNEENPLNKGPGFRLIQKLLKLSTDDFLIEVILVSKNNAEAAIRIFNSIEHHNLKIIKAAFSGGAPTHPYAINLEVDLFLSSSPDEVQSAINGGIAAATILDSKNDCDDGILKIAFDADAVIFDKTSEEIYKEGGIKAFLSNEKENIDKPLNPGPFYKFLNAIHELQSRFPIENNPIRTAIVTARGGISAPTRVIKTLRNFGIRIDEGFFLAGSDKGVILKSFNADIFFDDQEVNCEAARKHVPTGHVPWKNTKLND